MNDFDDLVRLHDDDLAKRLATLASIVARLKFQTKLLFWLVIIMMASMTTSVLVINRVINSERRISGAEDATTLITKVFQEACAKSNEGRADEAHLWDFYLTGARPMMETPERTAALIRLAADAFTPLPCEEP